MISVRIFSAEVFNTSVILNVSLIRDNFEKNNVSSIDFRSKVSNILYIKQYEIHVSELNQKT